jgi:DNA repair protein SbcC/Rad50
VRIHRLKVTAFGPYAATEEIDFDELNDAGIFLMTGPTGAGKTSLLDAVCFALYGVVPGDRGTKTLRSHHAPPDVGAEVELEVTLGARRLRIHRTPEWWRAKKRGSGVTKVQASARLLEIGDGEERLISHRIPEVGHELGQALGMSSEQFMQVVLLPQGRFQTFLHATSDERQRVLQRLFATERFARIEDWMQERAKTLRARSTIGERRISHLLGAVANRSGRALPDVLGDLSRGGADVSEQALAWAEGLLSESRSRAAQAAADDLTGREVLATLESRLVEEERVHALLQRHRRAQADLAAVTGRETELRHARDLVERHRRAEIVVPVARSVAALGEQAGRARSTTQEHLTRLVSAHSSAATDLSACRVERDAVTAQLVRLREAAPDAAELEADRRRLADTRAALAVTNDQVACSAAELAALPGQRDDLATQLAAARATAAEAEAARDRVAAAERRRSALQQLEPARVEATELAQAALAAREAAAAAYEAHLRLLERRLAGMADELARGLVPGEPCQVCGSTEHPGAPDRPTIDDGSTVTEADQQESLRRHHLAGDAADAARAVAEEAVTAVKLLEQQAEGRDRDTATAELTEAQASLAAAEEAAALVPGLVSRLTSVEEEQGRLAASHDDLLHLQRDQARTVEELTHSLAARSAALAEVIGDHPSLETATEAAESHLALTDRLIDSWEQQLSLEDRWIAAATQAAQLAHAHGFEDLPAATASLLDDEARRRITVVVEEVERLETSARRVLDDPEVAAAAAELGDGDSPDPAFTRTEVREARAVAARAASRRATTEADAVALSSLVDDLRQAVTDWGPDQQRHETADRLARLVRGTGGDNQLQMRLSSYVLATRLDQVLDAANERLGQMRDHRYELHRTDRGRGGTRAGLGLEVLDSWTGETRDAATLSGGETFVVSLALALGLADVVAQESGGTRVDTLFVDEGFSSLDPDTLDDVMDRIDALRAGGRTVGVVSHVTELRARIPTQLHVEVSRTGSTVLARTSVA